MIMTVFDNGVSVHGFFTQFLNKIRNFHTNLNRVTPYTIFKNVYFGQFFPSVYCPLVHDDSHQTTSIFMFYYFNVSSSLAMRPEWLHSKPYLKLKCVKRYTTLQTLLVQAICHCMWYLYHVTPIPCKMAGEQTAVWTRE